MTQDLLVAPIKLAVHSRPLRTPDSGGLTFLAGFIEEVITKLDLKLHHRPHVFEGLGD